MLGPRPSMAHYGGPPQYGPGSYGNSHPNYPPQQAYPQAQQPQQPSYVQPGYQPRGGYQNYGPPQHSHHAERPPKRQKGNPVITRYAPPPGYRPPPPGQPFASGPNQPPNHGPHLPPSPQNWQQPSNYYPPSPGWQQHPGYQQPHPSQHSQVPPTGYPQYPNHTWQNSQSGYSPPPPPPPPPPPSHYQQPPTPTYPPHLAHGGPPPSPHYSPTHQWPQHPPQTGPYAAQNGYHGSMVDQPPYPGPPPMPPPPLPEGHHGSRQGSRSSASHEPSRDSISRVENVVVEEKDRINFGVNDPLDLRYLDWDFDFDGPIWPKSHEDIDHDFSIGITIWHPAVLQTRALACQFDDAEEIAQQPIPKSYGNGESVSRYFTLENSHEAFLDIRQTDNWNEFDGDLVFRELSKNSDTVDLQIVIDNRDRPDEEDTLDKFKINVDRLLALFSDRSNYEDMAMEEADDHSRPEALKNPPDESLSSRSPPSRQVDSHQEDVLAALGVTGSPKAHRPNSNGPDRRSSKDSPERTSSFQDSETVAPPTQSRPQHRQQYKPTHSARSSSRRESDISRPRSPSLPRSLPPRSLSPQDLWTTESYNGTRRPSLARSTGSQHTAPGSDFGGREKEPEPHRPPLPPKMRSDNSRKRSYEALDNDDDYDGKLRQYDDITPKLKRRPRVEAAYSRR